MSDARWNSDIQKSQILAFFKILSKWISPGNQAILRIFHKLSKNSYRQKRAKRYQFHSLSVFETLLESIWAHWKFKNSSKFQPKGFYRALSELVKKSCVGAFKAKNGHFVGSISPASKNQFMIWNSHLVQNFLGFHMIF